VGWFLADITGTGNLAAAALTRVTVVLDRFTIQKCHAFVVTRRLNKMKSYYKNALIKQPLD